MTYHPSSFFSSEILREGIPKLVNAKEFQTAPCNHIVFNGKSNQKLYLVLFMVTL